MAACVPIPLNSCSIIWTDPDSTLPRGRLEAHARLHPTGGLAEVCDTDDCSTDGRGLSICLKDGDAEKTAEPTTCTIQGVVGYENPLRRDEDGCLWVRYVPAPERTCVSQPSSQSLSAGGNNNSTSDIGKPFQSAVTNLTCSEVIVRRTITVRNALIVNPPAAADDGVTQLKYAIDVDGDDYLVLAAGAGQTVGGSMTLEIPDTTLSAGETMTTIVQRQWLTVVKPDGTFEFTSGDLELCTTLVYPMTEEAAA